MPVVVPAQPVIVAAARTPIGTAGGQFASCDVEDLGAAVVRAVAAGHESVDDVFLGNCMGPGGNVARVAALSAGLGVSVPSATIDRQCASGLAAIEVGADRVGARGGFAVCGGVESASWAPWRMWPPTGEGQPMRYERAPFAPREWPDPEMGAAAESIARSRGVSRQRQDEYAIRSHERAVRAQADGAFVAEMVSVAGVHVDERPRSGFTVERLARFPAAFVEGGTVTAANSCGISDGAAAVGIVDATTYDAGEFAGGLRILATATVGVDPSLPGLAIVPAVRSALDSAGLTLPDVDVIEFNEAFAAQILVCCDELGLDDERVCREGGALALGHPWGASGAVLAVRLFSQLVHHEAGRIGLAAIAAGGGQGVAMVVERCP